MPQVTASKIIFDETDFLQGLHPAYTNSTTDTPAVKTTNKLATATDFNPYRNLGYATPGYEPDEATNASIVGDTIIDADIAYDSSTAYAYMITGGDEIHRYNILTNGLSNSGNWKRTISGTGAISGSDIINYPVGDTNYLFYSYNDSGGDWDVGRGEPGQATWDDDYMSTQPTGALSASGNTEPHPMVRGADDLIYIGDGRKLHGFDGQVGSNGEFFDSVLTLPPGYRITCFAKMPNFLVVFAYYDALSSGTTTTVRSEAKAFFWNYLDLDPSYIYSLDDNAVTAAVEYEGTVACFTQGRLAARNDLGSNRFSRLKVFDGSTFNTVQDFIGNAPIKGGAFVTGGTIVWNSDGIIHRYNSPYEGYPEGLNREATCNSTGSSTNGGICAEFSSISGVVASSGTGANDGLVRFKSGYSPDCQFATAVAEPGFKEGEVGSIDSVTVYFGKTSSSGRGLDLYLGTETGTIQFESNIEDITTDNVVKRYTRRFDGKPFGTDEFSALKLIGTYGAGSGSSDAPIIRRVVVEYSSKNITQ